MKMALLFLFLFSFALLKADTTDVSSPKSVTVTTVKKYLGHFYVGPLMANLHQRPLKYSPALTTFLCGDEIEVYEVDIADKMLWYWVKRGRWEGYLEREFSLAKRPPCIQQRYPHFFAKLELDPSQRYYWGRLYDLYVERNTKAVVK